MIGTQFIHKRAGALIPAMVHGLTLLLLLLQVASVVSDSVRPQRRKPTRLPHLWDSPGKNTGVGCHFLLQCMKVKSESEVAQWCSTLSDPMDCSLPGCSIHGNLQARVLEWVPLPSPETLLNSLIEFSSVQFSHSVMYNSL